MADELEQMDEAGLTARVKELSPKAIAAMTRGKFGDVAKIATKDYFFVDARGMRMSAGSCERGLGELVSNPSPDGESLRVASFKTSAEERRVFGNTVVETMIYTDDVVFRSRNDAEQEFRRAFRVTNVWVNQTGGVKLVATQLTPMTL